VSKHHRVNDVKCITEGKEFLHFIEKPSNKEFAQLLDIMLPRDDIRYANSARNKFSKFDDVVEKIKDDYKIVGEYCEIDSRKCIELLQKRNLIMDQRGIGEMSYVNFYDALYRADSARVRNLTISEAIYRAPEQPSDEKDVNIDKSVNVNDKHINKFNLQVSGIAMSNLSDDSFKGGKVLNPKKGLVAPKLSIRERIVKSKNIQMDEETKYHECEHEQELDDNSAHDEQANDVSDWVQLMDEDIELCDKIIEECGIIVDEKDCDEKLSKYKMRPVLRTCLTKFLTEQTGRPIGGLDFASLYPSIIMCYNLSPEMMIVDKPFARRLVAKNIKINRIPTNEDDIDASRAWSIAHCLTDPVNEFSRICSINDRRLKKR
jgi:hypothetical protein